MRLIENKTCRRNCERLRRVPCQIRSLCRSRRALDVVANAAFLPDRRARRRIDGANRAMRRIARPNDRRACCARRLKMRMDAIYRRADRPADRSRSRHRIQRDHGASNVARAARCPLAQSALLPISARFYPRQARFFGRLRRKTPRSNRCRSADRRWQS